MTEAYLATAVDACCLSDFNQHFHDCLLFGIKQIIIEEAGCARMRHEVNHALFMTLLWEAPVSLGGSL